VLALYSEMVLLSGKHPMLAMHDVEFGLGGIHLFGDKLSELPKVSKDNFGCLL